MSGEAQLSYLTRGLSWEASYNLVAPEEGEEVTVSGWITANNRSGTAFEDAKLKLIAGDVNMTESQVLNLGASRARMDSFAAVEEVAGKSFDGFHLYTLPRPVTLRDQETKQVEFLRSPAVQTERLFVYEPVSNRFYGGRNASPQQGEAASKDVAIYWVFKNSEENGLGKPMPAGTVRFYREDEADGNLEFVGENRIDHTPNNEELKVYTGNAFDLVGERKVMDFESNERMNWMKETIEVTLKNRSKKPQTIVAREHLWRWSNWEVKTDVPFEKIDSNTIEFAVDLAPDEVKTVSYLVTYSW